MAARDAGARVRGDRTARAGTRVVFKVEALQHGGSFKIRGALNRILKLDEAQRRAGVVAFSSGNHAQAVALAAHGSVLPRRS